MSASARVELALAQLRDARRPEAFISLRAPAALRADAAAVDARVRAGEPLALAGLTLAVKDNIDAAGFRTTAACPAFAYLPEVDAPAVARLRAAGAIVLGKTNLDQFATGLVGTRSPYGAVRDAADPRRVAGGSSSGSAVAVALGIADLALATDTAGSGRIPAAFQGIVGLKPTVGLVSNDGVVPACRSFDCVSVMAADLELAATAMGLIADLDVDPRTLAAPLGCPEHPRLATFGPDALSALSDEYRRAMERTLTSLGRVAELDIVDAAPFLEAGQLLYDGAFVAERHAAVGAFVDAHPDAVDPNVAAILNSAATVSASEYVVDRERLDRLLKVVQKTLSGYDGLVLPTAPFQPTLAEVHAAPLACNRAVGRYVTFCNLLDLCAVSLPAGSAGGGHFGVTLYRPGGEDAALLALARRLAPVLGDPPEVRSPRAPSFSSAPTTTWGPSTAVELLVVGLHMSGLALNHQLTDCGGRLVAAVQTAECYRLYALDTEPPKPGLVRSPDGDSEAGAIAAELWELPAAGAGRFLAGLPAPMTLGRVRLADGRSVIGFLCEPEALRGAEDVTRWGGWRTFIATAPSQVLSAAAPPR